MYLQKPELVPFRLTPNMLDGMGPAGYEGVFRRCSEVALRVLRRHVDMLVSVLESFIHDPLVEWQRNSRGGSKPAEGDAAAAAAATLLGTAAGAARRARAGAPPHQGGRVGREPRGHVHWLAGDDVRVG